MAWVGADIGGEETECRTLPVSHKMGRWLPGARQARLACGFGEILTTRALLIPLHHHTS